MALPVLLPVQVVGERTPARPSFELGSAQHGRAFVSLAAKGCGVGCRYCYIDGPAQPPVALTVPAMLAQLRVLEHNLAQASGMGGLLLAIGCDTEVSASAPMVDNALMCFEFARRHRLPVQLSTKYPLPEVLRASLESWPAGAPAPVVFTTITTVSRSRQVEPNAPAPSVRVANFAPHASNWHSYVLVKPFLDVTVDDGEEIIDLLSRHRPDGAVVGIRYRRRSAVEVGDSRHPIAPDWVATTAPSPAARAFMASLVRAGFRVFMNTRCVSAWHNATGHGRVVKEKFLDLCVGCGACP